MKSRRQTNEESPTSPIKSHSGDVAKRRTTYSEAGDTNVESAVNSNRALSIASGRALSIISARASSIASGKTPSTASNAVVPPVPKLPTSPTIPVDSVTQATASNAAISIRDDEIKTNDLVARKYAILRHDRCYLREAASEYPFPCDINELNRQTLKTLLTISLYGLPTLSRVSQPFPTRVLEVGCGTGLWSTMCHQYLARLGAGPVKFFGLDLAPVSPNLRGHGVDWEFCQHDLTKPLPYLAESFDFIMVKDVAYVTRPDTGESSLLDECFRVLRKGGTLEIWESDLPIRCLLPSVLEMQRTPKQAHRQAEKTGSYLVAPDTSFAESRNRYLRDYNEWIRDGLADRGLNPSPSTEMAALFVGEKRFAKGTTSSRRIAIPLGSPRWEHDPAFDLGVEGTTSRPSSSHRVLDDLQSYHLTPLQASSRETALSVIVQTMESLEPLLKQASGMKGDSWEKWWNAMMTSLLEHGKASNGECLELGAWWGTKA